MFLLNFHSYWSSRHEEPVIIYCLGWKIFSCVTIKFLTDPPSKLCNILMIPPHWQLIGSQVFCHPPPLILHWRQLTSYWNNMIPENPPPPPLQSDKWSLVSLSRRHIPLSHWTNPRILRKIKANLVSVCLFLASGTARFHLFFLSIR